ncbi:hypothetical protein [Alkalihalobacillus sp. CinArs1]|uniref:hypothetical protein n=1 Tax=Alkalihalobacillus sp. CinArs1 TaxID=2995314 RepID=UPI0022DD3795|nr:hypothetical protein [Alkalihalobacillus sp. CinArs1]
MKNCLRCDSKMVEAKLDSSPIRVYKASVKPNKETMSSVEAYACPKCGYIELYASSPEKLS